jgi:hypothetical protein
MDVYVVKEEEACEELYSHILRFPSSLIHPGRIKTTEKLREDLWKKSFLFFFRSTLQAGADSDSTSRKKDRKLSGVSGTNGGEESILHLLSLPSFISRSSRGSLLP